MSNINTSQLSLALQLADNALITGHRLSEWCGHGPILEQDIALANTSLDHLGTARSFYQLAADLFNGLPPEAQQAAFTSPALSQKLKVSSDGMMVVTGKSPSQQDESTITEDDLPYLRDGWDFRNVLLAEQPNRDWAYTIARQFYWDNFNHLYLEALQQSASPEFAAIAEKAVKEAAYHQRWSAEWVIRLGDGTDESRQRISAALIDYWPYTGELFIPSPHEQTMASAGIAPDVMSIKDAYMQGLKEVLEAATLPAPPTDIWMHSGGKEGRHTEHLGYILAEMQFMQRTYPGMEW